VAAATLEPAAAQARAPPGHAAPHASRHMSTIPDERSDRTDMVAGFLCAFSFAISGIALVRVPGLLAPAAIVVALVAARMADRYRTLAAVAVATAALAFFFGMLIAITTDSPLY
jgi:hypothetical protein